MSRHPDLVVPPRGERFAVLERKRELCIARAEIVLQEAGCVLVDESELSVAEAFEASEVAVAKGFLGIEHQSRVELEADDEYVMGSVRYATHVKIARLSRNNLRLHPIYPELATQSYSVHYIRPRSGDIWDNVASHGANATVSTNPFERWVIGNFHTVMPGLIAFDERVTAFAEARGIGLPEEADA